MMTTLVDNPACDCCPHIEMSDMERDQLTREIWDGCPESGCMWQLCTTCRLRPVRGPLDRQRSFR